MKLVCQLQVQSSVVGIGMDSSRLVVYTSNKKILLLNLKNLDKTNNIQFKEIQGNPIGKSLESCDIILEADQVITPGQETDEPGTICVQNYWFGNNELQSEIKTNFYLSLIFVTLGWNLFHSALKMGKNVFNYLIRGKLW